MNILITARQFTISEETRNYVENEIQRVLKVFDRVVSVHITLERIKSYEYMTQIVLKAPLKTLTLREKDEELTKSIDLAVDKMIRQIQKYKGQFQTKHEKIIST
ncbi:MAG: ribosome-associated translation inhibitor RaiA [Candidatus Neomarinimicrobiota bacterium]|jgi:ribosomal subunit interface protein|nr:ribosome-associated translation inhibitor RaiA [Candidatus Neomarinimicrobiota bacterium]